MNARLRHRFVEWPGMPERGFAPCELCALGRSNIIHRLGGRCSVCFTYHKHYELDASRRCLRCQP